ncbi:hypothetical protein [Halobaculum sp. MBLA0143]|uniref:DUF7524 family protein n=1 Tax=Halobaculum sp. MBLA0143 TaxID=3079933 RepID=UPI0035264966
MSRRGTLSVALNRDRLNGVSLPERFETVGDFRVGLENADAPVHVHLRLEGPLARVAETVSSNHYLEPGDRKFVDVEVAAVDESVAGRLTVVTGHGSIEESVPVTVTSATSGAVEVDPDLAAPDGRAPRAESDGQQPRAESDDQPPRTEPDDEEPPPVAEVAAAVADSRPDSGTLLVGGFAVGALLLAVGLQVTVGSPVVTLGLFAVLVAVAAAGYILLSE